jgi:hypothetical protein
MTKPAKQISLAAQLRTAINQQAEEETAQTLLQHLRGVDLPEPKREYVFHPRRKWRFDFAWPVYRIALEVNGGAWTQGRHTRGEGYIEDLNKLNEAQLLGWQVYQVTPAQVKTGQAIGLIERALMQASGK